MTKGRGEEKHTVHEELTDDVLKMYEVSGSPISEHSLRRYREDEIKWGDSIRQLDLIEETPVVKKEEETKE
jgi:hypothetical protein